METPAYRQTVILASPVESALATFTGLAAPKVQHRRFLG
jgi:hypothetical protein